MYEFLVPQTIKSHLTVREFVRTQGISLTEWRKIKNIGKVSINNLVQDKFIFLQAGDLVKIELPANINNNLLPEKYPLEILYEDGDLLAVNKPSGVLIHPTVAIQTGTLANYVMAYYQQTSCIASYHPVLRLDKDTSGIVLLAKSARVQHLLAKQQTKMIKKYLLLTKGCVFADEKNVQAPIDRKQGSIIEREVNYQSGQTAHTYFKVLAQTEAYYLLMAQLFTGRTHQIRVHSSYLGMPLLGDDLYGGSKLDFPRQALHAYSLELEQPISHERLLIQACLPLDMQEFIEKNKIVKDYLRFYK